jgi:hypothetical protein
MRRLRKSGVYVNGFVKLEAGRTSKNSSQVQGFVFNGAGGYEKGVVPSTDLLS